MKNKDTFTSDPDASSSSKTIRDFGTQWTRFDRLDNWSIEDELFTSITPPYAGPEDVRGRRIAEIGAGSGNMTRQLLAAGPERLVAVEPSEAMDVLKRNTADNAEHMDYLQVPGDGLPAGQELDWIFSIGVIHHIPEPGPTVRAAYEALKPGGQVLFWLYGHEGNELYLFFIEPLRRLTRAMGHSGVSLVSWLLLPLAYLYMLLCRLAPLPQANYAREVLWKMPPHGVRLVIYDQLNPHYAKYYTHDEAVALLEEAGFEGVTAHQRLGYSWTVHGTKPRS